MRIYVVDDHEIVREGLRSALPQDRRMRVVGESSTGGQALRDLPRALPDIVLTDYRLPDTTGDVLCRRVREAQPTTEVIIYTTYLNEDVVQRATDAGAAGFVTKASGLGVLREALLDAAAGRHALAPGGTSLTVKRLHEAAGDAGGSLTPHQERVLELTAQGLTYGQMAQRLHVSESTVRFHVQRLKVRLGVNTKAELIATAVSRALIEPEHDAPRS